MMKRCDIAVYAIMIAIFAASCAASALAHWSQMSWTELAVEVRIDGELDRTIEITRDDLRGGTDSRRVVISNDLGVNEFVIEGMRVRMVSSDCSGGDCVRTPSIGAEGGAIVCLPHRLVLRVVASSFPGGDLDGLSF